jgi:ubiquinol-cytochrome c reductase cytochrome c1 subunit
LSSLLRYLAAAAAFVVALAVTPAPGRAQETPRLLHQQWSFDGVFGTYDRAAMQRGFQVYKQVCSACHPVKHLYFRDLEALGYTQAQIAAIASTYQYQCPDGPNDQGQMFQRPCRASDPIPGPFPNDEAARAANGGALPPDLSMVVKAREGGPDYVYSLLNGFKNPPPPGFQLGAGKYYNEYFPGHQISMPPPLSDGAVTFADGTKATVPQMSHDVAIFLAWASEPNLDTRHRIGVRVFIFLIVGVGIFYAAKRKIWTPVH